MGHGALADVHDGHVGPYKRDMHDLVGGGRVLHRAWQNLLRERVDFIPSGQPPASAGHPDCLRREQAHEIFDALLLLGLLQFGHPLLYGRHLRPPLSPLPAACCEYIGPPWVRLPLVGWAAGSYRAPYEGYVLGLYESTVSPTSVLAPAPRGNAPRRKAGRRALLCPTYQRPAAFCSRFRCELAGYFRQPCNSHASQSWALPTFR